MLPIINARNALGRAPVNKTYATANGSTTNLFCVSVSIGKAPAHAIKIAMTSMTCKPEIANT